MMHGTELAGWLHGGADSDGRASDLGYWMGYRIAKSYYDLAEDKQQALADILEITDFETFLESSGYAETQAATAAIDSEPGPISPFDGAPSAERPSDLDVPSGYRSAHNYIDGQTAIPEDDCVSIVPYSVVI